LTGFDIARYLITNAQFKLFMDDDGYNPAQPWWDVAGKVWLHKNAKPEPSQWDNSSIGIARPNHTVVGVSWYEAIAVCRCLTQQQTYNPQEHDYTLPSEAEWEFVARGIMRRV